MNPPVEVPRSVILDTTVWSQKARKRRTNACELLRCLSPLCELAGAERGMNPDVSAQGLLVLVVQPEEGVRSGGHWEGIHVRDQVVQWLRHVVDEELSSDRGACRSGNETNHSIRRWNGTEATGETSLRRQRTDVIVRAGVHQERDAAIGHELVPAGQNED